MRVLSSLISRIKPSAFLLSLVPDKVHRRWNTWVIRILGGADPGPKGVPIRKVSSHFLSNHCINRALQALCIIICEPLS